MQQTAERLTETIQTLTPDQLAQVEKFIESLRTSELDRALCHSAATLSEPSFASIWDNPEDDAYDAV